MAGRPRKWDELEMDGKIDLVTGWFRNGATMEQIAENLGVNVSTLYEWKRDYPQFSEAIKIGRDFADIMVENALFQNALGYEYEEETVTNSGQVVKVKKKAAGNTAAQIFWLKNRKSSVWRDKQNIEHSGTMVQQHVDLSNLSDEELAELVKKNTLD